MFSGQHCLADGAADCRFCELCDGTEELLESMNQPAGRGYRILLAMD